MKTTRLIIDKAWTAFEFSSGCYVYRNVVTARMVGSHGGMVNQCQKACTAESQSDGASVWRWSLMFPRWNYSSRNDTYKSAAFINQRYTRIGWNLNIELEVVRLKTHHSPFLIILNIYFIREKEGTYPTQIYIINIKHISMYYIIIRTTKVLFSKQFQLHL